MQIYISFAKEGTKHANSMYSRFLELKLKPWMRTKSIPPGHKKEQKIKAAIGDSKFAIFLLSKNGLKIGGDHTKEIKFAEGKANLMLKDTVFIIPIRLDDCEIPTEFKDLDISYVDLFDGKDFEKTFQSILDSIGINSSQNDVTGTLTTSNELQNLSREANRKYVKYKISDPSQLTAETIFMAGVYSYSTKQFETALERYTEAIDKGYKKTNDIQSKIAGCYIKLNQPEKALKILEKHDNFPPALYNKAIAYKKLNRIKEAEAAIDSCLGIAPDYELARNNKANILLWERKKIDEAIATLQYLVNKGLDRGLTNYNLACYYTIKKKFGEAFFHLLTSFQYDPENISWAIKDSDLNPLKKINDHGVSFWDIVADMKAVHIKKTCNLVDVLLISNKADEALEKLMALTGLKLINANINYALTRTYCKLNDFEKALTHLDSAIKEDHSLASKASRDPLLSELKTKSNGLPFWKIIDKSQHEVQKHIGKLD